MEKKKWTLINTANVLLILLPCLLGFFLPPAAKESAGFLITWQFVLPLSFLMAYLLIVYEMKRESRKLSASTMKTMEILSSLQSVFLVLIECSLLAVFLNMNFESASLMYIIIGMVFLIIGNLLPKVEQNSVIGVRTMWALENRDNWNYSNRMTGRIWVLCGLALFLLVFIPDSFVLDIAVILIACIVPLWLSWDFYRRQKDDGTWVDEKKEDPVFQKQKKNSIRWSVLITVPILVVIACVFLFAGYEIEPQKEDLQIEARMESSSSIPYKEMESIELIENPGGTRVFGYDGFGLLMGHFRNGDLGDYQRYTRSSSPISILIRTDQDKVYVVSEKEEEGTRRLFQKLQSRLKQEHQ